MRPKELQNLPGRTQFTVTANGGLARQGENSPATQGDLKESIVMCKIMITAVCPFANADADFCPCKYSIDDDNEKRMTSAGVSSPPSQSSGQSSLLGLLVTIPQVDHFSYHFISALDNYQE